TMLIILFKISALKYTSSSSFNISFFSLSTHTPDNLAIKFFVSFSYPIYFSSFLYYLIFLISSSNSTNEFLDKSVILNTLLFLLLKLLLCLILLFLFFLIIYYKYTNNFN